MFAAYPVLKLTELCAEWAKAKHTRHNASMYILQPKGSKITRNTNSDSSSEHILLQQLSCDWTAVSSMLLIFIFDFSLFRKNHELNIKMVLVSSGAVWRLHVRCFSIISIASHTPFHQISAKPVHAVTVCINHSDTVIRAEFKMAKLNFIRCTHIDGNSQ